MNVVVVLSLVALASASDVKAAEDYGLPKGPDGRPHVKVVTIQEGPFVTTRTSLTGNERYSGFVIELWEEIAKALDIGYEFYEVPDGLYGGRNVSTGRWNGMVGELVDKKADVIAASLSITYLRERVISFTKPFMNTGITILMNKNDVVSATEGILRTLGYFVHPLTIGVWLLVFVTWAVVSLVIMVFQRFSPYEDDTNNPVSLDNFSFHHSLWYAVSPLALQGFQGRPTTIGARFLSVVWWFFCLVFVVTYITGMVRTSEQATSITSVRSLKDLIGQNDITYGPVAHGSTDMFFQSSRIPLYQKAAKKFKAVKTISEGVNKVGEGGYAFIGESSYLDYVAMKDSQCRYLSVGGLLDSKGYGFATQKNSKLLAAMSNKLLQMAEDGTTTALYQKWFVQEKQCASVELKENSYIPFASENKETSKVGRIGLSAFGGPLLMVLIGFILSVVIFLAEYSFIKSRGKPVSSAA